MGGRSVRGGTRGEFVSGVGEGGGRERIISGRRAGAGAGGAERGAGGGIDGPQAGVQAGVAVAALGRSNPNFRCPSQKAAIRGP